MAAYADQTAGAKGTASIMKRAHRKIHLAAWVILGPVMLAVLALAVLNRPSAPVNDALPDTLIEDAR